MSEYRRFVAYIYVYQNGKKKKNTGYVKVDVRDQNCRMQIQMQTDGMENQMFQIYGFVREQKILYGILLGEGLSRNGKFQTQLTLVKESLNKTEYSLDDLHGLWLKDHAGGNYISVWDEEEVDVSLFTLEKPEVEAETVEVAEVTVSETMALKMEPKEKKHSLEMRWEQFCCHYPVIQPFLESSKIQCLRIALKDIGFLGKEEWAFGTNPFVKQGFARYGHLVIGRQSDGEFILGVPGVCYDMQDRHLARMYGFPEFQNADFINEVCLPEGEEGKHFGYWYHYLKE